MRFSPFPSEMISCRMEEWLSRSEEIAYLWFIVLVFNIWAIKSDISSKEKYIQYAISLVFFSSGGKNNEQQTNCTLAVVKGVVSNTGVLMKRKRASGRGPFLPILKLWLVLFLGLGQRYNGSWWFHGRSDHRLWHIWLYYSTSTYCLVHSAAWGKLHSF